MPDVGLNFPITADPKQAEAEVKRFRAFVGSQMSGVSSDVKSSASSFNALRQSINQNAETTRGALARALLEGKKNIGGLVSEAKTAQKEFNALEKAEERALKMASGSGGLFSTIKSGLSSGIAQTALGFFGGNLLTGALTKVGAGLKDEILTGFDFLDIQERAQISFATIFKNAGLSAEDAADKATKHLQELVDFGAKTPFRTDQLIGLSQQLQAVGFKADEVIPTLRAVGDAVAGLSGDPEKLQRLITNLGQIKTTGQVSSRELREIAMAGVNAWEYLAQYSGKTVEQVRKLAEKNQLDADVAVKVIVAGMGRDFEGLMKKTEGTYSSMWSTIQDLNQQRAAQAFKPAFEEVKKGQAAAIRGLESGAGEGFAQGAADVQRLVIGGFDKILSGLATGDFKQLGFGALDSVVTGAKEGARGLYNTGVDAGGQLEKGWRDRMEQHSPSQVMLSLGFDAGQSLLFGFLKGVQDKGTLERIERAIQEAAERFRIDPDLLRALIKRESSFNPRAVSNKGAQGLTQLMPDTAAHLGVKDPFNIEQNIMGGAKYLRELFDKFNGDLRLTLAAYNAGPGRGRSATPEARLGKLYDENISGVGDYVNSIMRSLTRYQTGVDKPVPVVVTNRPDFSGFPGTPYSPDMEGRSQGSNVPTNDLRGGTGRFAGPGNQRAFLEWLYAAQKSIETTEKTSVAAQTDYQHRITLMAEELNVSRNFVRLAEDYVARIHEGERRLADSARDPRDMGLAELPAGHPFDASQFLKPTSAVAGLDSGIRNATQAQYELLKALGMTDEAAEAYVSAGAKAGAFGDLVKKSRAAFFSGADRYVQPVESEGVDRAEAEKIADTASAAEQATAGLHAALKDARAMGKATFGEFAQGLGATVQQYVLLGTTGPHALRKVTAQALASLSAEATVKALMALADGFVHLFTNPAQSAADFTAAAIYGSIAGVSAVAGRAVAGDIFKNEQQGDVATGGAGGTSSERDRTIREGRTGGAPDPFVIEKSRNTYTPPAPVVHREVLVVEHEHTFKIQEGLIHEHVATGLKNNDDVKRAMVRAWADQYYLRDQDITGVLESAAFRF